MIILDNGKDDRKRELVPTSPPFGSITDADWKCGRCGDNLTGCALCAGEPIYVVPYERII